MIYDILLLHKQLCYTSTCI